MVDTNVADTNVIAFPARIERPAMREPTPADGLLAKINAALMAMTAVHAELEALKTRLKTKS